jgi:hypothetical protein
MTCTQTIFNVTPSCDTRLSLFFFSFSALIWHLQIPVDTPFKAWVCGRSLDGIVGSNPAGEHGCLSQVSVVYCPVEVSETGLFFI